MPNHLRFKLALAALLLVTLACNLSLGGAAARSGTPAASASAPAITSGTPALGGGTAAPAATLAPQPGTPAAGPTAARPVPVTSHPRLWLTAADLPRLRSWAVASNPVFQNGLAVAAANARADMDSNKVPGQDTGSTTTTPYPSEMYAELFAYMSLISADQPTRDDYARRARTLLMDVMNIAVRGADPNQPFRQPTFSTSDRSRWNGEGFPLTVDWIYPYLSASDKATIRTVFLRWIGEDLNADITTDNHPVPVGTVNDPVLLSDPLAVRWSANNYYNAHMRNIGLMAMALDPADDPGGTLRNYLGNATGAWLYVVDHLLRTDALGGLAPEGFEYGPQSIGFAADFLLALHTAGQDDLSVWGTQVVLSSNPFWKDVATALIQSLSPATATVASMSYLGPVYQPAWYGAGANYWMPDPIQSAGPLGIYDGLTGNADQLNALRWLVTYASPGGADQLARRAASPLSDSYRDSIFYFMLFDPTAGAPADPRPNLPPYYFASGLGRLYARTGWDAGASLFTYALGWNSTDHQSADGNQFELYRHGEWLTQRRVGYDLDYLASDNSNTLSLQNSPPAHNDPGDYRAMLAQRGSQWPYVAAGDGRLLAHSFGPGYVYALGDATNLYNSNSEGSMDITQASRSIVWLEPDHILVYDRAASRTAGRFKRFWLNLPSLPVVSGNRASMTTASGQQLFVTTLLPANAAISGQPAPKEASGDPAREQTMQDRLLVEAPNGPADVRFLNVLQGADPGAAADAVSLIQSSAGPAYAGAVVRGTAVLFPVDISVTVDSLTYVAPPAALTHLITGLVVNGGYDVLTQTVDNGVQVIIRPGAAYHADSGGVLAFGPGIPATPANPPTPVAGSPTSEPASGPSPTSAQPPTAYPAARPTPSPAPTNAAPTYAAPKGGQITYRLGNNVFRVAAAEGATPQNVSAALNALGPGQDSWLNISPGGAWLMLGTERFDPSCAGWPCLAVVSGDLSSGAVVSTNGQPIHPDAFSAISANGSTIVYPSAGGPHAEDLWAVSRAGSGWGAQVLLTGASPYAYNAQPAISLGGGKVLFDCGDQPYAAQGTAICEVGVAGGGFRTVLAPANNPPGYPSTGALHHPAYAPDGSVVFEGNWGVEQIWRLAAGASVPKLVTTQFTNDNSPCVLPDNRIASLWLGRPGNPSGLHELKVMAPDGTNPVMLVTGQDVDDVGLGCG